jgi:hypothetical protein
MLPDLTHMLAFRVDPHRLPADVRAGWMCHVAVDRWFHADEHFRSDVREMSSALVKSGWNRWSAQAACHVSWELQLDGHLARASDPSTWYEEALHGERFRDALDASERASWDRLVEAQFSRPLWQSYKDTEGVVNRTWRRLGRTRLAFSPNSAAELSVVLDARSGAIAGMAETLINSAVEVLISQ